MVYKKWFQKLTGCLLALSAFFVSSAGCHWVWGETELPQSIRDEYEK